jgi:hypothetical protein
MSGSNDDSASFGNALLAAFPGLTSLRISSCMVKGPVLSDVLLPRLEKLVICHCKVTPETFRLKAPSSLTEVDIVRCSNFQWGNQLSFMPLLTRLSIASQETGIVHMEGLDKLQRLQHVRLHCESSHGFSTLISNQLRYCTSLQSLDIRSPEDCDPDMILQCRQLRGAVVHVNGRSVDPILNHEFALLPTPTSSSSRRFVSLKYLSLGPSDRRVNPKWMQGVHSLQKLNLIWSPSDMLIAPCNWMAQLPANHPWLQLEELN